MPLSVHYVDFTLKVWRFHGKTLYLHREKVHL